VHRYAEDKAAAVWPRLVTPPDSQMKGGWYPGGFNPCAYQVKTGFKTCRFKCNLRRYSADYIVVNVSSPNTPGLRNLQSKQHLKGLMTRVMKARDAIEGGHRPPVLLKIAPDLTKTDMANIAAAAIATKVDGRGLSLAYNRPCV
jgi:hypothetical protein